MIRERCSREDERVRLSWAREWRRPYCCLATTTVKEGDHNRDRRRLPHCQQCNDTHANDYLLFCPGTWRRLQYVLNVFIIRSFVKSLSMPIDSLLTTIFFLETKSLPSIPTKRYESEPDLPKPKLLLPNAGRSNRHCLSIEKTSNRQRRGKLTMSSRLAG